MDGDELKWRQYALLVDLDKFYLDLFLKSNIFFYAVTGAIMSVYLTKLDSAGPALCAGLADPHGGVLRPGNALRRLSYRSEPTGSHTDHQ
jgi:hypothetical protein